MTFLMILFIKMSFFHYNIAKAIFAIKFVRHRIWKKGKYSMDKDFEAFIYCDKLTYLPGGRKSLSFWERWQPKADGEG